ncbi:MAG: hypothetical protein IJ489_08875 [Clostridia bacterium]|nr:hypothetical protein [Clostridia bacterium]
MLLIQIEGLQRIDEEIQKNLDAIKNQAQIAFHQIGGEMVSNLQDHIQNDWYIRDTAGKYKRRTDFPAFGTPLGDRRNMTVSVSHDENNLPVLSFVYEPTGEHKKSYWHDRDGDDLIDSIQEGTPIGKKPRPFWDQFAKEQLDCAIIQSFINAMKPFKVEKSPGGDVLPTGEEYDLKTSASLLDDYYEEYSRSHPSSAIDYDDDLPF